MELIPHFNFKGYMIKHLTPIKAIKAKCLDCQGGRYHLVRKCDIADCPLFIYRFGKNPHRSKIGGNPTFIQKFANSSSDILQKTGI